MNRFSSLVCIVGTEGRLRRREEGGREGGKEGRGREGGSRPVIVGRIYRRDRRKIEREGGREGEKKKKAGGSKVEKEAYWSDYSISSSTYLSTS